MERATYHHGALRRALIDAARALLAEEDPAALSLRAVARRAGVSSGAPYHHFADKPALLAEVALEGWRRLNTDIEAQGDALEGQARAYLRFGVDNPGHYRVMFLRDLKDRDRHPELHEEAERALGRFVAQVAYTLERPPAAPEIMGRVIAAWSTLHGFVALWNDGTLEHKPFRPPLDALLDAVSAAAVRAALGGDVG